MRLRRALQGNEVLRHIVEMVIAACRRWQRIDRLQGRGAEIPGVVAATGPGGIPIPKTPQALVGVAAVLADPPAQRR